MGASFRADLPGRLKAEAGLTTSLLLPDPGIDVHSLVRGWRRAIPVLSRQALTDER